MTEAVAEDHVKQTTQRIRKYWWLIALPPLISWLITSILVVNINTYRSFAVVELTAREGYLLTLPSFQERVRTKLGGATHVLATQRIADSQLYNIEAIAPVAEVAQLAASSAISSLIEVTSPTQASREYLEAQRSDLEHSLNELNAILSIARQRYEDEVPAGSHQAIELGSSIVALVDAIDRRSKELRVLGQQLGGTVSQADVLQEPTPPAAVTSRRQGLFALANAMGAFLLASLAVIFLDIDKIIERVRVSAGRKTKSGNGATSS